MVAKMLEEQVAAWRAGGNLEFFDRLRSESKARLLEHTVPIYRCIEGGVPIAHGSGVLLRIAGVPFLLSCAHVLQDAAQPNTMLFVDGPVGGALIPLRGTEFHRTTEPGVDLGFADQISNANQVLFSDAVLMTGRYIGNAIDLPVNNTVTLVNVNLMNVRG